MKKLKIFEAAEASGYYYRELPNAIPTELKKRDKKYAGYEESNIYVDKKGKTVLATYLHNGEIGLVSLISEHEFLGTRNDFRIKEFFNNLTQEMNRL